MNFFKLFNKKPQTLGEGLQRVKEAFGVIGENTSQKFGTRTYKCFDNKYKLNIESVGNKFDSCLSMGINEGWNKLSKNMFGKISGLVRRYSREIDYNNGRYAVFNKKRTAIEKYTKDTVGNIIPGRIAKVKTKYNMIQGPKLCV